MKSIIFDAGPLISLTLNNLLWVIKPLEHHFDGDFWITDSVKRELIDEPIRTKKYKFEAIQIVQFIGDNTLTIIDDARTKEKTLELLDIANNIFHINGRPVVIVHYGEVSTIAAALMMKSEAIVIDERITRELIEHPTHLAGIMSKKLRAKVKINHKKLNLLKQQISHLKVIRSIELAIMAFELGLLDRYLGEGSEEIIPDARKNLLESILWGLKTNGCSISRREIDQVIKMERKMLLL